MKTKKVTVQEVIVDIGAILNKINTVLKDHEQRLQLIDEVDLRIELELIESRILKISDLKKQEKALQLLKNLCDTLDVAHLELSPV